ncbi:MAG: DUF72 domain-containing protein, partial [bacterium]|nr:DUF72 domain-containing protein [bacterium]
AARINRWLESGRDVFAYFDNDFEGNALINARQLEKMVARISEPVAPTRQ